MTYLEKLWAKIALAIGLGVADPVKLAKAKKRRARRLRLLAFWDRSRRRSRVAMSAALVKAWRKKRMAAERARLLEPRRKRRPARLTYGGLTFDAFDVATNARPTWVAPAC